MLRKQRRVSHISVATEATFPIRADASAATNLSSHNHDSDIAPTGPPSTLPYPSLAPGLASRNYRSAIGLSTRTLSLTGGKSSSVGFFASIGRKASMNRSRPLLPPPATRLLSKAISEPRAIGLPMHAVSSLGHGGGGSSIGHGTSSLGHSSEVARTSTEPLRTVPEVRMAAPTIPGGPRARPLGGRAQRSTTVLPLPQGTSAPAGHDLRRVSTNTKF
ncbi:hypothetical protein BOTBODRAFT_316371 [Botryobasidium botryosum FD-172 SS1]|uniref:Uncharacterized protein n=1 Tax=Botryobasidium botryosum (strain FD-172 SS1) TaxID=930990 RepID=A0A067N195_BOTB1|nr:hypothetical protein BOTBODRAFT_316371 [Botryobasidium botryosum FD-172 SS1]